MSTKKKNILFIMFDQLRFDYLSCAGHPYLETPHIDRLAKKGVRFSRCYAQSTICGSSRMSFYTGRYVHSHGSGWNNFPLRVGELTLGDHLRPLGMETVLVGKTHMSADTIGMERLGLDPDSMIGARVAECGFDVFERDDGMKPEGPDGSYDENGAQNYNEYLRSLGYESENPWHDFANSGVKEDGDLASGWFLKYASEPANIKEEHSETPYMTGRAIDFIEQAGEQPWLCHLSYIKPHWPYIVPTPYHNMYSHNQVLAPVRHEKERENPHPIYATFMERGIGQAFSRDEVRDKVIPAYMGLIKQCDDQMGRLFKYLEDSGQMENTVIVVTSDHGDYLGDHWMGEKDLFHDQSVRIPLIIYNPDPECDAARGTVCDELVEAIDLAATFVEIAGGDAKPHVLEGHSLMPFLKGETPEEWREFAVSEYDYSITPTAAKLNVKNEDARLFMIVDKDWKFIHGEGFRPMLFDLNKDAEEFYDLGESDDHKDILDMMYERLGTWGRRQSQRITRSDEEMEMMRGRSERLGIILGVFDENEKAPELTEKYRGKAPKIRPAD